MKTPTTKRQYVDSYEENNFWEIDRISWAISKIDDEKTNGYPLEILHKGKAWEKAQGSGSMAYFVASFR